MTGTFGLPRWRLLNDLAARRGATATALATDLPVSRQAVVKHLGVLERAGLVSARRAGREMRYTVHTERVDATARWMAAAARRWDDRLATIKAIAEAPDTAARSTFGPPTTGHPPHNTAEPNTTGHPANNTAEATTTGRPANTTEATTTGHPANNTVAPDTTGPPANDAPERTTTGDPAPGSSGA